MVSAPMRMQMCTRPGEMGLALTGRTMTGRCLEMTEYIKKEDAIELFWPVDPENDGSDGCTVALKCGHYNSDEIEAMLSDLPAADVAEVRWSPVIGFEGKYEISTLGQVRNNKGAMLKPTLKRTTGTVYKVVRLWKEGQYHTKYIHRLVAEAFIPNPGGLPIINHKDEDGTNNLIENLEWCTQKYNTNYGTGLIRMAKKRKGVPLAKEHKEKIASSVSAYYKTHTSACKGVPSKNRKPIVQCSKDGAEIKRYSSIAEATDGNLSKVRNITANCNGKRKSAYGFVWKWDKEDKHEAG